MNQQINCHHNYTEQEKHFGKTVWLWRKGAIDASAGMAGLIPARWVPRPMSWWARATGWR